MEHFVDGLAKYEDVVNQFDAAIDVFDEGFGDTVEMVSAQSTSLRGSEELIASHLVYHEGRVDLVVLVERALIITFPQVDDNEDGGRWGQRLGQFFWTLKWVWIAFQVLVLEPIIQD